MVTGLNVRARIYPWYDPQTASEGVDHAVERPRHHRDLGRTRRRRTSDSRCLRGPASCATRSSGAMASANRSTRSSSPPGTGPVWTTCGTSAPSTHMPLRCIAAASHPPMSAWSTSAWSTSARMPPTLSGASARTAEPSSRHWSAHHFPSPQGLRQADLVGSERQGLWAYYYVIPNALTELSAWLD